MKDSGIEWIGEIPEDWSIVRMKSCIAQRDGGAWGEEANNSEGDCICLRVADFDYNKFRFSDSDDLTIRHYSLDIIEKLKLEKNDILVEKSGGGEKTPVGRTVLFDKTYTALYANFMDRLRCSNIVKPSYMQYVFVTFYKNEYTRNYIKQTTGIQNLDLTSMLSKELIPLPSMPEQQKIADFLDKKCSHIDSILEKTKASIDECKQLKQSVITQAVTKGIRPNRPMKDSGIEWIGEIPQDWEVAKIGNLFNLRNEKNDLPEDKVTLLSLYTGIGVFPSGEHYTASGNHAQTVDGYKIVKKNDIVVNIILAWMGAIGISDYDGVTSPAYDVYIPDLQKVYPHFYHYVFRTSAIAGECYKYGKGIMMMRWRTYSTEFKQIRIPFPPINIQQQIADFLDNKCSEIDKLITKKEQLIAELETYKKSLIYEYVTGKKEVI